VHHHNALTTFSTSANERAPPLVGHCN
jgi:hypothetical protein